MKLSRPQLRFVVLLLLLVLPASLFAQPSERGRSAFLKSLVVPGWGQYSLGRKNSALGFLGADVMLVGGMLTLSSYGRSTRADYKALASAYAGVVGDHDHDFYVDVANWMTVDEYNERRLQQRDFDALYTSAADYWAWDTEDHRAEMENLRIKSDRAFNNIIYLVGGVVLNHIASAIHAGRLAARLRAQEQADVGPLKWDFNVEPVTPSVGIQLRVTRNF